MNWVADQNWCNPNEQIGDPAVDSLAKWCIIKIARYYADRELNAKVVIGENGQKTTIVRCEHDEKKKREQ